MIDYTQTDIQRLFPGASFQKGLAYQRQHRVHSIKYESLSNGTELLMARVRGSGRNVYSTSITLSHDANRRLLIEGDCSCPVGEQCKHVVATLLQALTQRGDRSENPAEKSSASAGQVSPRQGFGAFNPLDLFESGLLQKLFQRIEFHDDLLPASAETADTELDDWLRHLEQLAKPTVSRAPQLKVVYLLGPARLPRLAFEVSALSCRVLKNGQYGKGTLLRSRNAGYIEALDKAILGLLDSLRQGYYAYGSDYEVPSSAEGAQVLSLLLDSGRCFWQDKDSPPLGLGPSLPARAEWQLQNDGSQRLKLEVEGLPEARLLALQPPWYLDLQQHRCGPLETGLAADFAAALVNAPALRPELSEAVRQRLGHTLPAMPLPRALQKSRKLKQKPVPCLYLHRASLPLSSYSQTVHGISQLQISLARLSFDYAGQRVNAFPPAGQGDSVTFYDQVKGELIEVSRNVKLERQARQDLLDNPEYDFFPLNKHPLHSAFSTLPEELEHDHFMAYQGDVNGPGLSQALTQFSLFEVPKLRAAGWRVEMAEDYEFRVVEAELIADWYADVEETTGIDWFGLELGIHVSGEKINLLPLLVDLLSKIANTDALKQLMELPDEALITPRLEDGRILPLPIGRVRDILGTLIELFEQEPLDENGRLRLQELRAAQLAELEAAMRAVNMRWLGGERLLNLGRKLKDFKGIQAVTVPPEFQTTLRQYQQEGLNWLQFLREYGLGGVLADDMGLGKTVQALAHVLLEKRSGRMDRPCLVVAPTSLMLNWRQEAERFAPALKILTLHGTERKDQFEHIADHDLVLTTYPLLPRDKDALQDQDYHLLILDEAQHIKNPKAKVTQIVHQLRARHRLCLTGTPMENHLGELWSLCNFLMPGLLGDAQSFRQLFRNPIEKDQDHSRSQALARRIKPFLLRRTKQEVVKELPEKTEILRTVELDGPQRDLYETIRLTMHDKVRREVAQKGMARSQIIILDALLKLRQVCCDPRLLKLDAAKKVTHSAKLRLLMDMLPELVEEGRKVLLFSQFTSMLALIEIELQAHKLSYVKLTGQTRNRGDVIEQFQNGDAAIFLISLKAGGTGLNLTAADTVIHYDPWWNPAVENQATDRAHRIGQDKRVFVYKLQTLGTVEEKIQQLQARKQQMADALFSGNGKAGPQLSNDDLEALFEPLG